MNRKLLDECRKVAKRYSLGQAAKKAFWDSFLEFQAQETGPSGTLGVTQAGDTLVTDGWMAPTEEETTEYLGSVERSDLQREYSQLMSVQAEALTMDEASKDAI